ncbi:hypothetical protein F5Y15DRAFT_420026 [Xylariaceae sp. FL0016]|nr:hypothetical protein F5Y15DRAFT_420026 [Xylariaceae sp. FL0016]
MPSLEPRRRSRARFEEDDAEQSPASDTSNPKRQRYDMDVFEDGEEEQSDRELAASNGPSPGRHTNGHADNEGEYQPGAIVRVVVRNFVTYEHAEFLPGPNLNMVIGPNGTGKSSLVCAICLGMGYHPKHLGRAGHVGEFVKHGKDVATIEIELQKRPTEWINHIIRVQISREDNGRKWWLNGKESSHKAVQELVRNLHIQIDNLCQFLPQDKVAEFAGLTPVQLLHHTLRAAAPAHMIAWQDALIDLHKDQKTIWTEFESCAENLSGYERRQQALQADVDRLHEREVIEEKVQDLRSACGVAEYSVAREAHKKSKERSKEATGRLRELETACGPALEAVNRKMEYRDQIEPVVAERKKDLANAEQVADQLVQKIEIYEEKIKNAQDVRDAEDRSLGVKRGQLSKIRKTITDLEAKLKSKPPEFVASDWNVKIRQKETELQANKAHERELNAHFQELKKLVHDKKEAIDALAKKKEDLNSQEGQKLLHLKKIHPDAATGWDWLQENRGQFVKEVFGPPMLTCSVKDKRYSNAIQSLLGQEDFTCFISQTTEDHKRLSEQFYGKMKLSVTIRTCGSDFSSFRPPIPSDQARQMGLDGYAIEHMEGPEPVLAMLCAEKRLHASGVALHDVSNSQFEQIMHAERISSWATGQTMYRVTRRREYGSGAVSTSTRRVMPGRFWTDEPVDDSERVNLSRQENELKADKQSIEQEGRETRQNLSQTVAEFDTIKEKMEELKAQKSELQRAATSYSTLGDKINTERRNLEHTQGDILECRSRILEKNLEEDNLTLEKTRAVLQHRESLLNIRDAHQALLNVQIRLIEANSDVKGLEAQNEDIKNRLDQAKADIEALKSETDAMRKAAEKAKLKVVEAMARDPDRLPTLTALAEGKTPEDLQNEIAAEENKLHFVHAVDKNVLEQFKSRAQKIEDLNRKKEAYTAKLESLTRKIDELKQKWEPKVEEIISRINDAFAYNFEQISCAGEVGIHKDEDFEQWAIEIKVKFRPNETLQQLNQHRQSGGERAVSTIFYLMALQSMAQAPFRVVDEINQGMDPRNERMVHERMVEIACREHTSQYFLITPKLLTGLRYDPRMRVLCIASGHHMPAEGRKLDFKKLVQIRRAIGAAA